MNRIDFSAWTKRGRKDGVQQFLVGAVIFENGKILVVKRKQNDTFPGHWEIPGGKVEPNETLDQALVRECMEETGLEVEEIIGLSNIFDYYSGNQKRRQFNFWIDHKKGPILLTEHDEYRWISRDEIDEFFPVTDNMKESIILAFKNLARVR